MNGTQKSKLHNSKSATNPFQVSTNLTVENQAQV